MDVDVDTGMLVNTGTQPECPDQQHPFIPDEEDVGQDDDEVIELWSNLQHVQVDTAHPPIPELSSVPQQPSQTGCVPVESTFQDTSRVEDVEDSSELAHYVQYFPSEYEAGVPLDGQRYKATFEPMKDEALEQGNIWSAFKSDDKAELAQWLFNNIGLGKIDEFLHLCFVSSLHLSTHSLLILYLT
jgi:hypothetical protein